MARVAALIMGRAGSVGVPGKNIRPICGRPLVAYPLEAAYGARLVDRVYVTTDCDRIKEVAGAYGATVIDRPDELSRSDSEMSDGIMHAVSAMDEEPEILVTMHANCGIHREGLVDECVRRLIDDRDLDSCVSVRFVDDMHPYRLKRVLPDGTLTTWLDVPAVVANNRQNIPDRAVVLDGAARAFRPDRCLPPHGQPPFRYLGNRIAYVENPGGLDVHSEADLTVTAHWLTERAWRRAQGKA